MTLGYVIAVWPMARYSDNVAKIVNELSVLITIACMTYLKKMKSTGAEISVGYSIVNMRAVAGVMFAVLLANLLFHAGRLSKNSVDAARTVRLRR